MSGAASSSTTSLPLKPSYNIFRGRNRAGKQSLDIPEAPEDEPVAGSTTEEVQQKERNQMLQAINKLKRLAGIKKDKKTATPDVPAVVDEEETEGDSSAVAGDTPTEDTSETAIAKRIAGILSSVPPFYTGATPTTSADGTQPKPAEGITDPKLLNLLSTTTVMNGTRSKGRRSVWSLLDRITVQMLPTAPDGSAQAVLAYTGAGTGLVDSSIMLVAPLQIDANSKVELAQSEIRVIEMDAFDLEMEAVNAGSIRVNGWWPWSGKTPAKPPPKTKQVRVWIPSPMHVSFQASWWGFRLYLPPPVLKVLNDTELAAAQRAALIMAALQWLVSNAPMASLPLPLITILGIVKAVLPVVGYIGGFIAWSWTQIKSYDKGQGVVLSATWLLPIALIPSTWDYVPPKPPPSPPAPAPAPDTPNKPTTDPTTPAPAPTTPVPAPTPPTDPSKTPPAPAPAPSPPAPVPNPEPPITITPPPELPIPGHDTQTPIITIPNPTGDPSAPV